MRHIKLICDLQYGSTGKGQIAGAVARTWYPDTVATAWGPNAGHTFRSGDLKFVSTMLATSALAPSVKSILIGPGSVIDVRNLGNEIYEARALLRGKELVVHPNAVLLNHDDAEAEATTLLRIGSTMKGTAEATIRKIRRQTNTIARDESGRLYTSLCTALSSAQMSFSVSDLRYDDCIDNSTRLIIEGSQGFSLGLHTEFYPYCTSRDISPTQMLADCRIPFRYNAINAIDVIGVARTYPIRVANRMKDGVQVGSSGPCYPDQEEITWESIGREPELTTVTKLPRRIFTLSDMQLGDAARICNPRMIALTFMDYVDKPPLPHEDYSKTAADLFYRIEKATQTPVMLSSWGPDTKSVYTHVEGGYSEISARTWE